MESLSKKIKDIQNYDSLHEAGKITGKSYKDDEGTGWLGMALQMQKVKEINELLDLTDDTKFSETTEEYTRKVLSCGFERLLFEEFDGQYGRESFSIYWHSGYSILLTFDTFCGNRNGAKFYYNWSQKPGAESYPTESGTQIGSYFTPDFTETRPNPTECPKWDGTGWDEYKKVQDEWYAADLKYRQDNGLRPVWSGSHDGREAIKNNIKMLAENGEFLKNWLDVPFLWLLHHMDTKAEGYDYETINKERISKLPPHVVECMFSMNRK
jgi:hypothetical protein